MPGEETTTKFKVDISELKKAMQDAKREISIANSEFKAVSSSMDDWSKSTDGISAKLKQLDSNLKSQKTILNSLEQQYAAVVAEQGEGSKAADNLKVKINNQKAAINQTEREISNYEESLKTAEKAEKIAAATGKDAAETFDKLEKEAKAAGEGAEDAGDGFTVMKGGLANLVSDGINLAVNALKDLGKAVLDAYKDYDSGADTVIAKTGAVGEEAAKLQESYKAVSKSVTGNFEDIGTAVGEVSSRFGVTGGDLENLSTKFLKFAELNGTDVNGSIDTVQKSLAAFGLESTEAGSVLDTLNKVGQDTGISMDTLSGLLVENASSFSQMGLDVHQAASFLGDIEKSGVTTSTAMTALSKASQYAAEENKPLTKTLEEVTKKMKNAKSDSEGLQVAYDVFGKKAGAKIYEACKTGSLSFDDLSKAMQNNSGSIDETYEATQDGMDKISLAFQGAKAEVGNAIGGFLDEHKDEITGAINTVSEGIKNFFNFISENKDIIIAALAGIAAGFIAFNVANMIMGVVSAFKAFKAANEGAAIAQWLLNAAMNANPIMLIVTVIAAVIAAIVAFIATNDNARAKIVKAWNAVKEFVGNAIDAIVNFFTVTVPNALNNMVNFFKQLPGKIWTFLVNVVTKIVSWGTNLASKGKEAATKLFNSIVDKVKSIPGKIAEIGKNIVEGLWKGINGATEWLKGKIKEWVGKPLKWAKEILGIHSPSTEFALIGKYINEGLAEGIDDTMKLPVKKAEQTAKELLDESKKILEDHKAFNNLYLGDELKYWDYVRKLFEEGTEERIEAEKEYLAVKNQQKAELLTAAKDILDKHKVYNKMHISEELAYWDEVRQQFEEGTEERIEADKEYLSLKEDLTDQLTDLEKDYQDEVEDLNDKWLSDKDKLYEAELKAKENYTNKKLELEEKLQEDTEKLWEDYYNQVEKRAEQLATSFNLFDAVNLGDSVTGETLSQNLDSQIEALEDYEKTMSELSSRGLSATLISELRSSGVKSLNQIKAIASMSDEDLKAYDDNYNKKLALSRQIAESELASVKTDTINAVNALQASTDRQIKAIHDEYLTEVANIATEWQLAFDNYQKNLQTANTEYTKAMNELTLGVAVGTKNIESTLATNGSVAVKTANTVIAGGMEEVKNNIGNTGTEIGIALLSGIVQSLEEHKTTFFNHIKSYFTDLAAEVADSINKAASGALPTLKSAVVNTATVGATAGGGVVNNFTQVINSPKQLSRLDIYRQSKNLLNFNGGKA